MSKRLTTQEFIDQSKKIHNDKYDYSRVEYLNNHTKVCIICPEHGEFWQYPQDHKKGVGCPYCSKVGRITKEILIEKGNKIHNNKYSYDKSKIVNCETKVVITCPIHGDFNQSPHDHLRGAGCPECGKKAVWDARGRITTEDFINECKKIHGNKYIYDLTEYLNNRTKVKVVCPYHGVFEIWPQSHKEGDGCPYCSKSNMEKTLFYILKENNINFINSAHFLWLGRQHLDFYLPDYNIAIECQGEQHYIPVDFGGIGKKYAEDYLKYTKKCDTIKKHLCEEKGIKLLYCGNKKTLKYDGSLLPVNKVINVLKRGMLEEE